MIENFGKFLPKKILKRKWSWKKRQNFQARNKNFQQNQIILVYKKILSILLLP